MFRNASRQGDLAAVDAILRENKIDPKVLFRGRSLLVEAMACDASTEVLQYLIDVGMSDLTDKRGFNPLVAASLCSSPENVKILLEAGFSTTSATGKNALAEGIFCLSSKNVFVLVKAGVSVADFNGFVPLALAQKTREILKAAGLAQDQENNIFTNPTSVHCLQDMCRNTIRKSIKTDKNLLFQIAQISQIPKPLKGFLVFNQVTF